MLAWTKGLGGYSMTPGEGGPVEIRIMQCFMFDRREEEVARLRAEVAKKDEALIWLVSPDGPLYGVDSIVLDRIESAIGICEHGWIGSCQTTRDCGGHRAP